jgi:hypothetical protein
MAERKPPERSPFASIFTGAAIASPVAIGAAMAYSGFRSSKGSSSFGHTVQPLPMDQAYSAVQNFQSNFAQSPYTQRLRDFHVQRLSGMTQGASLPAQEIRRLWYEAASVADPTGGLAQVGDHLRNVDDPAALLSDLESQMRTNTSRHGPRALAIFNENLAMMQERATAGLPLESVLFDPSGIPRHRSAVGPAEVDPRVWASIQKMHGQLSDYDLNVKRFSRTDVPGSELRVSFRAQGKPDIYLRLPEVLPDDPRVVVRGGTQQSKYIAGHYYLLEGNKVVSTFNHTQWMAHRAETELVPAILREKVLSQRVINQHVSKFSTAMHEPLEWIPTMPAGEHRGIDEYLKHRRHIARLYTMGDQGIERVSQEQYYQIMKAGGVQRGDKFRPLYPGTSGSQIAHGTAMTVDPRGMFTSFPMAEEWARRPLNPLRMEYTPSARAMELMAQRDLQQRFGWMAAKAGPPTPLLRIAAVASAREAELAGRGLSTEGQILVSRAVDQLREVQHYRQYDVQASGIRDLAKFIDVKQGTGQWNIGATVDAPLDLGTHPVERTPVRVPAGSRLISATAFADDPLKGDFLRVMALDPAHERNWGKVFGIKATEARVDEMALRGMVRDLGVTGHLEPIEAVITADHLRKNRALHHQLTYSALWDTIQENMNKSGPSSLRGPFSKFARRIADNPAAAMTEMSARAYDPATDIFRHDIMLRDMFRAARAAKFTPEQMGRVFGSAPEVFGLSSDPATLRQQWTRLMMQAEGQSEAAISKALQVPVSRGFWERSRGYGLSPAEASEISKGVTIGTGQLFYGADVWGGGAGKAATLEPRFLELLRSPQLGIAGRAGYEDLASRLLAVGAESRLEEQSLVRSLESMLHPEKIPGATPLAEFQKQLRTLPEQYLLPLEESAVSIKGVGDIRVPGTATVQQLMPFQKTSGEFIRSELGTAYRRFLDASSMFEEGKLTREELNKEMLQLQRETGAARVKSITHGMLRQPVPGSQLLQAVSATEAVRPGEMGLTRPTAQRMFAEMSHLYPKEEIAAMQKQFLGGEAIPGWAWRNPATTPYSIQPTMFRMITGEDPVVMVNERLQRAVLFREQLNAEALESARLGMENARGANEKLLRKQAQKMGGEFLANPIRLSPLIGAAGDVDGDRVAAAFAGPQTHKTLTTYLNDEAAREVYEQYAIRRQVMKPKAAAAGQVTTLQQMAGSAVGLGLPKAGQLGRMSVQIQQYRAAVLGGYGAMDAAQRGASMAFLDWLEETPISGKQLPRGKEHELVGLMSDIEQSLSRRNAAGIAQASRVIMEHSPPSARAGMMGGFSMVVQDAVSGHTRGITVPGLNIGQLAEHMADSTRAMDAMQIQGVSATRARSILMGQATARGGAETAAMLDRQVLQNTHASEFFTASQKHTSSGLASKMLTMSNQMGSAGRSVLKHAKPLAIGGAVAVGLATVLSSPPSAMSKPLPAQPDLRRRPGAQMVANLHPDTSMDSAPSVPDMTQTNSARITGPSSSHSPSDPRYNVTIRGLSPGGTNYNLLSSHMRGVFGGRASVSSSVHDYRTSLTAHKISDILSRG